ncbi:hypothetical protein PGT21_000985 [Puccinia graminis f. sp. tritici]|uniref:Uncharacterized protein n=1 Tax=Puccinia graminis f. sp. tritici TaxID=56615 RepID=A0A5B0MJW0_PUCGR|nr:hypothetical protein PGT21_000985 [Puccinia graminis f. sp. tritici]KAA1135670.1 hypothetical protein PGTUg99_029897 [Puccinia graminis f. sp. tritici]
MSLPFGVSDMEESFAPQTNYRKRPFAPTLNLNRNTKTTMSSSTLSPPWMKNKKTGNLPIFRTGINKTLDMDEKIYQQPKQQEPIYQQPTNQNKPVLIEQPGLFYDGHHFMQFLRRYEMTADSLNASKYDRALQIGRFVRTEELKCQIESMDGYEECDWDTLLASMIELWGDEYEIWYTTTDLVNLSEEFSRDNKTVSYQAFQTYLQKFSKILDFLLIQKQLRSRQDALVLFISAFPQELQRNIKRNLNHNGRLRQAPNGSRLPPLWEHLTEAAGIEIKLEEEYQKWSRTLEAPVKHPTNVKQSVKELAKEIESLKQQLQDIQSPVICNTPHSLSQLEPRKDYTELETDYTELETDDTEPATDYTELETDDTEPRTDYTELETDDTEPAKDYTELETDYTELATDYMELAKDYTEPAMEFTKPVMDVPMPARIITETERETIVEESVTLKLLDLEEWKAASINVMDTPMEIVQTVIEIPDIILDEPDTENNVDQEESLDKSTQPETLDHLPNPVKIENLLLAETSEEDPKFPAIPGKFWICNINKYLKIKIFNKQLFKPHLGKLGLLHIDKQISRLLEIKNTQIEEPEDKIISVHVPLAPENFETTDLPISSQPFTPSISTTSIPEKVFSIPTPPDPPDITATLINPQNEANWKTRQLSKLPINNLDPPELPRELFLLSYLLQKILSQLPISIPPDPLQKSYGNIKPPRLLVGVG